MLCSGRHPIVAQPCSATGVLVFWTLGNSNWQLSGPLHQWLQRLLAPVTTSHSCPKP